MVNWTALASDLRRERPIVSDNRRLFDRVELPARPRAHIVTDNAGTRTVGLIKDISLTGLGLVLGVELVVGQFIVVDLEWRGEAQLALAQIIHAQRVDDGMYRVGAEFFDELPIAAAEQPVPLEWLAKLPSCD